jgi:hypothetical protein
MPAGETKANYNKNDRESWYGNKWSMAIIATECRNSAMTQSTIMQSRTFLSVDGA